MVLLPESPPPPALHRARLAVLVHIAGLSADERLIHFDFAAHHSAGEIVLHGKANALKHEPRGFLRDAQIAVNLPGGNTIAAIRNEPHNRHPLFQADGRVFHDRADLDGELASWVPCAALPAVLLCEESGTLAPAGRANHYAIGPTLRGEVIDAVLFRGKVLNRFE